MCYVDCCLYKVGPTEDKQQACLKHLETYYWHKLIEYSAKMHYFLLIYFSLCYTDWLNVYVMYTTTYVIFDSCIMFINEQKQVEVKVLNGMLSTFYRILCKPFIPMLVIR